MPSDFLGPNRAGSVLLARRTASHFGFSCRFLRPSLFGCGYLGLNRGGRSDHDHFIWVNLGRYSLGQRQVANPDRTPDLEVGHVNGDLLRYLFRSRPNAQAGKDVLQEAALALDLERGANEHDRDFGTHDLVATDDLEINVRNGVPYWVPLDSGEPGRGGRYRQLPG